MHYTTFPSILAEAYRRAALAGQDMHAFAGSMEQVQSAIAAETDLYIQWERLTDRIGEALWMHADPAPFQLVYTVFLEDLGAQFALAIVWPGASETDNWRRWRAAFSEASFHWRYEALHALCHTPALQACFGKKIKPYEQFLLWFRDRRWVETRAVFQDLAMDQDLPEEQRGYHHYVCGQIDLYFHYEYAQAKHLFETAETMLAGKPLALHGSIEYLLKGPEKDRNLDRALELADAALQLDPDHGASMLEKGDILLEMGRLAEAEALYHLASRKHPGNALCYTRLIELYGKPDFFEHKQTEIETLLKTTIELEPDARFRTRSDVAVIFQNQGEAYWPKAKKLHEEAIEAYPEGIMARLNLGYYFLDVTKELEKADAIFQEVVVLTPEAREGYLALARLREAQGNWGEAIKYYQRVQEIIPTWERFMLVNKARCLRMQNQLEAAETSLLCAWELDTYDDSGAISELYELAERLYKDPEHPNPDGAVHLLQRALEVHTGTPDSIAGLTNRQGHALFYESRYAEALPYYRKAAAIVPTEPVYFTNQFDCLEKMYRETFEQTLFEEALEALNRAARLAPQDSSIPKKRRQLARVRYNPHLADQPLLYQVHVEVGPPLLGEITQDFQTLLPGISILTEDLRKRMNDRYAINLPGVRYRDITDGDGAYQFRLYETPVLYASLPDGSPPTMAAVLEQLEIFLTNYGLDLFVNYWDVDREVPFLPNAELIHFTRTVMALLAEGVPLPPLPELHRMYRSLDGARLPAAEVVEKLRCSDALLPNLPGRQPTYHYIRLEENEERMLVAGIVGKGNARALALPPDYMLRLFGAMLLELHKPVRPQIALVVGHDDLRPLLRSALSKLPYVPILKTSELPADAEARFLAPLKIAARDSEAYQQDPASSASKTHLPRS
jgi:tetratricopeptide (TPR) repeat protein